MEKTQNIQHWYIATYPKDELGPDIPNEWTFPKLWHALNNSNKTIQEFSIILDWSDSIIRERVFAELAERENVEYDVIYELWLKAAKEEREEKLYTADMKNGIINASLNFVKIQSELLIEALDEISNDCNAKDEKIIGKAQYYMQWLSNGIVNKRIKEIPQYTDILKCSTDIEKIARNNNFFSDQLNVLDMTGSILYFLGTSLKKDQ